MPLTITPLPGIPAVQPGDNLAALLLAALERTGFTLTSGDILILCQKIVSKAEGRVVRLSTITASPFAERLAAQTTDKDPRIVEDSGGTYYLTYTAYNGSTCKLSVATSTDLITWQKHGPVFRTALSGKYLNFRSKSSSSRWGSGYCRRC
jgi:hypothetical protein